MNKEAFKSFFSSEYHRFLLSVSNDDIQDHFTFSFCEKEWHWMYGNVAYPQGLENERTTIIRDHYSEADWSRYPKFHFIFLKGTSDFLMDFSKKLPKMMAIGCKVTWHMNDFTPEKDKSFTDLLAKLKVFPTDGNQHQVPHYYNIRLGATYF